MENVNDSYFDGYYKEIWRTIIPDELTTKEIEFIISYFKLHSGDSVLDLMCGYGRHAISLGRKGISVTAVDNLDEYVSEINTKAVEQQLPVLAVKSGVLEFSTKEKYDLALCMGNSLNFFNAADTVHLLKNISGFLKKGGHLLINSWSLTEIVTKAFRDKTWSDIGKLKFLTDSKFLFSPTRMETEHLILAPDGKMETKKAVDYIFSVNEIEDMTSTAGLLVSEIYSIPGRKKFALGEPRVYIIAVKS